MPPPSNNANCPLFFDTCQELVRVGGCQKLCWKWMLYLCICICVFVLSCLTTCVRDCAGRVPWCWPVENSASNWPPRLRTIGSNNNDNNARLTRDICSGLTPGNSFWRDWHQLSSPSKSPPPHLCKVLWDQKYVWPDLTCLENLVQLLIGEKPNAWELLVASI